MLAFTTASAPVAQLNTGRFLQLKQLPWLPKARSRDLLDLTAVPPVQRVPGTTWEPKRHCLGWPKLVDHRDLQQWLAAGRAPLEAAYHLGRLSEARYHDERLDLLAFAIMVRSQASVPRVGPCGHVRGGWIGSGCVTLRQVQVGPNHTLYLARRRTAAPSAAVRRATTPPLRKAG